MRNSHKGDGRTAVWAILFNDGTLKRRGHLIHFRHELRQIPLPSVVCIFVRKILRPPITDFDSQITVICNGSVIRPFSFTAAWDSAVYRTISNTVGLQRELRYCDRFLKSHCFCFDCQPSRLGQNSGQSFDQCFVLGLPFTFLLQTCFLHLNFSFINLKSILTP